jgi:hypothetical protein
MTMKILKSFQQLFEMDVDNSSNLKMRNKTIRMVEASKQLANLIRKAGTELKTKETENQEEERALRSEALDMVKSGDSKAYQIMKWSDGILQTIHYILPAQAIKAFENPYYGSGVSISYREEPDSWCTMEIYNTPNESKSVYMTTDGEVIFEWGDLTGNSPAGTKKNSGSQLI